MKFSVRLPNGQVRPFQCARVFAAYVVTWPETEFFKVWQGPFHCSIQSIKAPF